MIKILAATVDYNNLYVLYERCTPDKKAHIHWKVGIVTSCYIMIDTCGDMAASIIIEIIDVPDITLKIKSQKFY